VSDEGEEDDADDGIDEVDWERLDDATAAELKNDDIKDLILDEEEQGGDSGGLGRKDGENVKAGAQGEGVGARKRAEANVEMDDAVEEGEEDIEEKIERILARRNCYQKSTNRASKKTFATSYR
jgi:hypothetical protein